MRTHLAKPAEVKETWHLVNAEGRTLGRLAARVAGVDDHAIGIGAGLALVDKRGARFDSSIPSDVEGLGANGCSIRSS